MTKLIQTPVGELKYIYLAMPDSFQGDANYKCTIEYDTTKMEQEEKVKLHNLICFLTKSHPSYDLFTGVYEQAEKLKIFKKFKDTYSFTAKQRYNVQGGKYIFKPDVYKNGVKYQNPVVGADDPYVGLENPVPMMGVGTTGQLSFEVHKYDFKAQDDGIQRVGINLRLKRVDIETLVLYQKDSTKEEEVVYEDYNDSSDDFNDEIPF